MRHGVFVRAFPGAASKRYYSPRITLDGSLRVYTCSYDLAWTALVVAGSVLLGGMNELCELNLVVPSNDTPRIQEMHIMIGHIICQAIDDAF